MYLLRNLMFWQIPISAPVFNNDYQDALKRLMVLAEKTRKVEGRYRSVVAPAMRYGSLTEIVPRQ